MSMSTAVPDAAKSTECTLKPREISPGFKLSRNSADAWIAT
jgi:hypothetical protein